MLLFNFVGLAHRSYSLDPNKQRTRTQHTLHINGASAASDSSTHLALVVVEHQPSLKVVSKCAHRLIAEEVLEEGGGAARLPHSVHFLVVVSRPSLAVTKESCYISFEET